MSEIDRERERETDRQREPGNTWRRDTEAELPRSGSWKELEKTAQSWVCRRSAVGGLCTS